MKNGQRIAIVTGGSRGIGAAISRRLARDGTVVNIIYRESKEAAEHVVSQIKSAGGHASMHRADVSNELDVKKVVEDIAGEQGAVHILVNNAGISDDHLLMTMTLGQWENVLRVNLTSAFLMCRAVVPFMLDQSWGRIINISSNSARRPGAGQTAYAASKGGLEALTRGVAVEVGRKGVRINTVAPGAVRTDMTAQLASKLGANDPGAIWAMPEDICGIVAFLASDEAGYIQGEMMTVDGGRQLIRSRSSSR
jgi:3-oxoacyl-[acyl-carrier protein] reductase